MATAAAQQASQADADRMRAKVELMIEAADGPRAPGAAPRLTSFTDQEANAYAAIYGPTFLPDGVADPRLRLGDGGRVTARAIVNLDAVRTARSRDWLDPLAYATGSLEVVATGFISGVDGMGAVRFESATLAGVAVPKSVVQELVRFYTTSPELPNGFGLDDVFALPGNIRSVTVEQARATVTQ